MRLLLTCGSLLLAAACTRPYLAPVAVPPPAAQPTAFAPLPRAAQAAPGAKEPAGRTDEAATRAWLDRTIEERRAANPDTPPVPLQQTVERTVYVDRAYAAEQPAGYDEYGRPVYGHAPAGRYETPFPVNTALGAGIGAIIGHQSHHQGEGAAIGAGVGLLFDLLRWSH